MVHPETELDGLLKRLVEHIQPEKVVLCGSYADDPATAAAILTCW